MKAAVVSSFGTSPRCEEFPIPSAALRAARLQIVGSGQGSVSSREILTSGTFDIDARPVPLRDVEQAWADAARTTQRIVMTPQPGPRSLDTRD
jgi:hypothetical protein